MDLRVESDSIGTIEIPEEMLYGINTQRAKNNFNISNDTVNIDLTKGIVLIKKSAAIVNLQLGLISKDVASAIIDSCDKILKNDLDFHFITHPLQGGAGTSTNMNVNEVIANLAIEQLGGTRGDYSLVHPINDVNCSQSTNDVYPTAIRIASIYKIRKLAKALAQLQESLQKKENEFADVLKLGRTQLSDALPITLGQEFGSYARAISRDRWRIYKVEERLREVNIGGTAIGTSLNASLEYIYKITETLQNLTGLGLARSDFLVDPTQNMDIFVEVSGLLKSCAVNLIKIANDIRLMASGPKGGLNEIHLQPLQAGSSIMPGKVNPVMCEMLIQVSYKVIGNDSCITAAAYSGQLELNAFSPLIADSLLNSLELLTNGIHLFDNLCIKNIKANETNCTNTVKNSSALSAVLIPYIGYDKAADIATKAFKTNKTIETILLEERIFTEEKINHIMDVYQVTNPGISERS